MTRHAIPLSHPVAVDAGHRETGVLVRLLRLFGPVEEAEAESVLLLLLNLFVLLFTYYLLKTVREPLILATGGAEMKSYAAAFQAVGLVAFVPAYAWLSRRLDRTRLVVAVVLFFAATLEGFYLASFARVPYLGFAFFVWLGIFSNAMIALFWSIASDIHGGVSGERLFPVIAVGAAAGSPVGSWMAKRLFAGGMSPYDVMHVGALLILVHLAMYRHVEVRTRATPRPRPAPARSVMAGFSVVARSPYLRLLAVLLVLLNIVNTTGEYILARSVVSAARAAAAAEPGFDVAAYIGAFYGRYYFWVNVAAVVLQAFAVSRLVKRFGVAGAVLVLPIVAFGAYALVAIGPGLAAVAWAKGAENAVDYSAMSTGKQMLWLPTSGAEKYEGKQVVDGLFVRVGDLLAAAVVFLGTHFLGAGVKSFAVLNLVLVVVWVATAWGVLARYRSPSPTP